jgi:hypothetical protein
MGIIQAIEKYLDNISADEFHRYKSWDNCHQAFSDSKQAEIHTLELAFYLASWGMYRGSSGLLQKNHLVHTGAVDILFSEEGLKLKCNQFNEVSRINIKEILSLKYKLANHYCQIYFTKGADNPKPISPTDTLLSKILLGTLGCIPAYDRYFIEGLKETKMKYYNFNDASINEIFDFIDRNKPELKEAQELIFNMTRKHYPVMKILDMFFWQIGYDKEIEGKKIKATID